MNSPSPPSNSLPPGDSGGGAPTPRKNGLAALVIHHSITVLILVLFLALGVWGYLTFQSTDFFASVDRSEFEAELRPALVEAQHQRLEVALHVANHLNGRYPGRLAELVEMGLLLESDLYYPSGGLQWLYTRQGDSFTLELAMPEPPSEES